MSTHSYSLIWTQLPLISWILPFIGHLGISDSEGNTNDFHGPYTVVKGELAFGEVLRYFPLDPGKVKIGSWNDGVVEASSEYSRHNHNLFFDNCHHHVCFALNRMNYDGSSSWKPVHLGALIFFRGNFVSLRAALKVFLPPLFFWALVGWICLLK